MYDVKKDIQEVLQYYEKAEAQKTSNFLLISDMGAGKTRMAATAPAPVWIDSFDPRGTQTVRDQIAIGRVIADTRYELDDPRNPQAFKLWDEKFHERLQAGFFEHLGTYCLDSTTTWVRALMHEVMKRQGRPGAVPQRQDYLQQLSSIYQAFVKIASLPCNVVVTGHIDRDQDEMEGRVISTLLITKSAKITTPLLFSEVYVLLVRKDLQGRLDHVVLTRNDGVFQARTRIGAEGRLDVYEKPDIRYILHKCGLPSGDKPPLVKKEESHATAANAAA